MPRIRKKTSNRGTTHQREKLKHKVAESRKKAKKAAKKDTTWKSKHTKDPGIPNNFPYKDEILAEVAAEQREAEEAKQRKKDAKKAAKAAARGTSGSPEPTDAQPQSFDGVRTLAATASKAPKAPAAPADADADSDTAPPLIDPSLPTLRAVLSASHAFVLVLDARAPLASLPAHLLALAKEEGKHVLLVLTKIECCPREALQGWTAHLRAQGHTVVLFRAASAFLPPPPTQNPAPKAKAPTDDAAGASAVLSALGAWANVHTAEGPFTACVLGLANAGKSALVSSLLRRAALAVYRAPSLAQRLEGPSTTPRAQAVELSFAPASADAAAVTLRLIDTPGIAWVQGQESEEARVRDILLRNRGRIDHLKDPMLAANFLVTHASSTDLILHYSLPAFAPGDTNAFLMGLARSKGLVRKAGVVDVSAGARIVLRDFATGALPWHVAPPPSSSTSESPSSEDEKALTVAGVVARKEWKRAGGVKMERFIPAKEGEAEGDERRVELEAVWDAETAEADEEAAEAGMVEDEEDVGEEEDEDELDEDEDVEEDEEVEEEEEALPTAALKRKRPTGSAKTPARPAKKVAFAAPAASKKAQRAAAARGKDKDKDAGAKEEGAKPKSALKKSAKPKSALKEKKAAPTSALKEAKNVGGAAGSKKAKGAKEGEDAYDFGTYFR